MKKIGKYFGQFVLRGLIAMGFGPIVLTIVYAILGITGVVESVTVLEMTLGIISITALAFLCGGINVFYQIEELPLSVAITVHGVIIYIAYVAVYFTNGWIESGLAPFLVFTGIFVVGYLLVWVVIYLITRKGTDNVNNKLKNRVE